MFKSALILALFVIVVCFTSVSYKASAALYPFGSCAQDSAPKITFEKIVSHAVLAELEHFFKENRIVDDVEKKLFFSFDKGFSNHKDSKFVICLLRPGKQQDVPKLFELRKDGKVLIQFQRIYADVPENMAVVFRIQLTEKEPIIEERILSYNKDRGWKTKK